MKYSHPHFQNPHCDTEKSGHTYVNLNSVKRGSALLNNSAWIFPGNSFSSLKVDFQQIPRKGFVFHHIHFLTRKMHRSLTQCISLNVTIDNSNFSAFLNGEGQTKVIVLPAKKEKDKVEICFSVKHKHILQGVVHLWNVNEVTLICRLQSASCLLNKTGIISHKAWKHIIMEPKNILFLASFGFFKKHGVHFVISRKSRSQSYCSVYRVFPHSSLGELLDVTEILCTSCINVFVLVTSVLKTL